MFGIIVGAHLPAQDNQGVVPVEMGGYDLVPVPEHDVVLDTCLDEPLAEPGRRTVVLVLDDQQTGGGNSRHGPRISLRCGLT